MGDIFTGYMNVFLKLGKQKKYLLKKSKEADIINFLTCQGPMFLNSLNWP